MQRTAVFVDAGYLFAQGSVLLTGSRQGREQLSLDIPRVTDALRQVAFERSGRPLLRIYWYDAMRVGRPTPEQMLLADSDDIKIRLGQINAAGEQKGVDALIITDLADLARNRAVTDAVLVSGDEDLRVGVLLAQQQGVRVHLVGIQPARANQSRSLRQEADTTAEWDAALVGSFLTCAQPPSATQAAPAAARTGLDEQITLLVTALDRAQLSALKALFATTGQLPQEHDRTLLRLGRQHYGQSTLTGAERTVLREAFVRVVLAFRPPTIIK